jgi:hypothetical protein
VAQARGCFREGCLPILAILLLLALLTAVSGVRW